MDINSGNDTAGLESFIYKGLYKSRFKRIKMTGDIRYEYNPFHNLQLKDGSLSDFTTSKLNFNLKNPVDITIQPSYDGSANLILNDDLNPPRLINSRFTILEDKKYERIDRKGSNDTNIYQEEFFDIDTRLLKATNKVPYIKFNGLAEGGNLRCGNYAFYFKYSDADTNSTDFICETGEIPVYIGNINDPKTIRGGMYHEMANKIINLSLYNLDESYEYIDIYYSRKTSNTSGVLVEEFYKLNTSTALSGTELKISINGFESVTEIAKEDINVVYNIIDRVKTQTQAQNTLFFANVDKQSIDYNELADLSLRILPFTVNDKNIGRLNETYDPIINTKDASKKFGYYDAKNVYDYTGYWEKEIYRLGICYIMKNDEISPVFDIRGRTSLSSFDLNLYTNEPIYETVDGKQVRKIIKYNDDYFINNNSNSLENVKGVIQIAHNKALIEADKSVLKPVGLQFYITGELMEELSKNVKGFFFVRQKRIPTILTQGITIGVDKNSYTPLIYAKNKIEDKTGSFITESFINKNGEFVHNFGDRKLISSQAEFNGLLCPEALFKSNTFENLFTGSDFNFSVSKLNTSDPFIFNSLTPNSYYIGNYKTLDLAPTQLINNVKLTMVNTGSPVKYSGSRYFSSRAGIPEEVIKFSYLGFDDKSQSPTNIIRGEYTGFVGMENISTSMAIYDVHTPGYKLENMKSYFGIRFNSLNEYYAISDRYDTNLIKTNSPVYDNIIESGGAGSEVYKITCYRGDCYISNITLRIQRNFQDPELPINDTIIDSDGWRVNYKGYKANGSIDKEAIAKINRADVNAVRIGHWVTFMVMSNINMCYRSIDATNSSEYALTGNPKSFYPLSTLNTRGTGKINESFMVNTGYDTSLNNKNYFIVPDVPYINNRYSNRILYSDISVDNSFKNGYRVFQGLTYKDLTSQYGAIVKVIEFQSVLIIVFENGVGMLPVNERTLITESSGGDIYVNSPNVINKVIKVLSSNYGSIFSDSITVTANYVYGFDTTAKKIWRATDSSFEVLSDFKIQKYLNDNILLSERDIDTDISNLDVRTHFNAFKQDVIFIFYNKLGTDKEKRFAITYNEQINKFISFNSWYPIMSENINNIFFSTGLDECKKIMNGEDTRQVYVYRHGQAGVFDPDSSICSPKPCNWYGEQYKFEYEFVVADKPSIHKIFNNLSIVSNNAEPESITFEVVGDAYDIDKYITASSNSKTNKYNEVNTNIGKILNAYKTITNIDNIISTQKCIDIKKNGRRLGNIQYLEDIWNVEIKPSKFNDMKYIKDESEIVPGMEFKVKDTRIRDKYCKIKVSYTGDRLAVITALNTIYTESYA